VAKKPKYLPVVADHAMEDSQHRISVALPDDVRDDRALMCRLHHRVVDLLDKKQMLEFFYEDVEDRLAALSAQIVSDFVAKLLKEVRVATK
jgi:hypothetical protein